MAKKEPTVIHYPDTIPDHIDQGFAQLDESSLHPRGSISYGPTPQDSPESRKYRSRFDAQALVFTTAAALAEVRVDHDLQRVPKRFTVLWKSAACDVYAGPSAWTTASVFLIGSVAGVKVTVEVA